MEDSTPRASGSRPRINWNPLGTTLGPLLGLVLVVGFFAVTDWALHGESTFLSPPTIRALAKNTTTVAVAALGMTVIIIAGGIDLSAGTALALSATVLAWFLKKDYPVAMALAAAIGAGLLTGFINGVLISALRVVPFIVTLGTMTAYLGVAKIVADETTVRPALNQVPAWLEAFVARDPNPEWQLFAPGVWVALALAVLLVLVLRYTVFGRYVFALGSNESTVRLCGINVSAVKIAVYTLSGFFVGVAGIYQFAILTVGNPTSGSGMELKIIAAVVIGGASLSGGRGSVLGTLVGAAMMQVIDTGCMLLEVSNPVQDIIIGVIIVAAVTLDKVREQRLAA
jgi:ribose transport system permease protein